jgi:N-acetylglucosaminyl-diphospho-decaprenol L-rhamnosyltransferase
MPSGPGSVAVVTVTYNSADELAGFLDSVSASRLAPAVTIVADNPSDESERSAEIVAASGVTLHRLDRNVGYGGAVNAAVERLEPGVEFILVSNPDVRLESETIGTLLAAMTANQRIALVGPKIVNEDGSIYPSARRIPSLRTGVGHALFVRVWPTNPWTRRYRLEDESTEVARTVGWLSGSCFLMRRSAFEAVGGFDASYFMYFEDVDLGYRLGRAGWLNHYEPLAVATHYGGRSTASARPQMLLVHHRSADQFMSSKYPGWYLAPVRWGLHVGLYVRGRWLARKLVDQEPGSSESR